MPEREQGPLDDTLLERVKKGDKTAFELFYNKHKRVILNYAYRMIGDRPCAEEITQETFVKAYVNISRYVPQGKPLNWIYRIAGNLCRNFLRDKKYEPRLSLDAKLPEDEKLSYKDVIGADKETPRDAVIMKEQDKLIQTNIALLPVKYREVVTLCDMQGYSYEEAAEILKCRIGSVGSRLSKARGLLAKGLRKYFR